MPKITLKTLFDVLKTHEAKFEKSEAKADIRFEFLKEQIQSNHAEAKADFKNLQEQVQSNHTELKTEIGKIRRDVSVIRDQTAHITERVTMIEHVQKEID